MSMKRIVTGHSDNVTPGKEPVVEIFINAEPEFITSPAGNTKIATLWTTQGFPSSNQGKEDEVLKGSNMKVIHEGGSNIRFGQLMPGAFVPMHRTSSIDYNIVTSGKGILITPKVELDPNDIPKDMFNDPRILKTEFKQGDVIIQRGTLHGWSNESDEPVSWISVILPAEPVKVGEETLKDGFWM